MGAQTRILSTPVLLYRVVVLCCIDSQTGSEGSHIVVCGQSTMYSTHRGHFNPVTTNRGHHRVASHSSMPHDAPPTGLKGCPIWHLQPNYAQYAFHPFPPIQPSFFTIPPSTFMSLHSQSYKSRSPKQTKFAYLFALGGGYAQKGTPIIGLCKA